MNGKEAYDEIRKFSPQAQALFVSGYPADKMNGKLFDKGTEIIMKPFSPLDMKRKIRQMLDNK
jgi:CheY-like chemotaxis protein